MSTECGLCEIDTRYAPWVDCPEVECPYKRPDEEVAESDGERIAHEHVDSVMTSAGGPLRLANAITAAIADERQRAEKAERERDELRDAAQATVAWLRLRAAAIESREPWPDDMTLGGHAENYRRVAASLEASIKNPGTPPASEAVTE